MKEEINESNGSSFANFDKDIGSIERRTLEYQVKRDLAMVEDKPNILLLYERLVKQFGYVILFSFVFPVAGITSYFSNSIEIKSQIKNLHYQRRFRAQVSFGIGNWLGCLENLCQLGIIINCAGVYFTSRIYHMMFTTDYQENDVIEIQIKDGFEPKYSINTGWNSLKFFIFVVIVEHLFLVLKLVTEYATIDKSSLKI